MVTGGFLTVQGVGTPPPSITGLLRAQRCAVGSALHRVQHQLPLNLYVSTVTKRTAQFAFSIFS